MAAIIEGIGLSKAFLPRRRLPFRRAAPAVHALADVSLAIGQGEAVGIVGESGSGKTTLARVLLGLEQADAGTLLLDGTSLDAASRAARDRIARSLQMVFQDSAGSLNPRLRVIDAVAFGPRARGRDRHDARDIAEATLEAVGLPPRQFGQSWPHQLSGGQRQRVNIARALALEPRLLVLDEPVSALDKSVEAQVLNLLVDLRERRGLALLMISHDLAVVRYVCDRVVVMHEGSVVENCSAQDVFERPAHDYTRALIAAMPRRHREPRQAALASRIT